jgi:SAM-dependent methyltransferase
LERSIDTEILDRENVPDDLVETAYRDLTRIHRFLGDTAAVAAAVRGNPVPVRRILDVGCARGGVIRDLRRQLGVEVLGVDLRVPAANHRDVPIIRADAIRDALPQADLAFSMNVAHHLSEDELIALIRNVGCYCPRFLLLDLVRHPLPLALFRIFVAPMISKIAVADGLMSIRRAFTAAELRHITRKALSGTASTFRHRVYPFYIRQTVDISYSG